MQRQWPQDGRTLIEFTTGIVAAFLRRNPVQTDEVAALIGEVHTAVCRVAAPEEERPSGQPRPKPAVPIRQSVTADYIVCLEDGAKLKSLKRHLMRNHGMTIDGYRRKWGLPLDYPVIASSYSAARSALAKRLGLGRRAG